MVCIFTCVKDLFITSYTIEAYTMYLLADGKPFSSVLFNTRCVASQLRLDGSDDIFKTLFTYQYRFVKKKNNNCVTHTKIDTTSMDGTD